MSSHALKVSVICTIKNEADTLGSFLRALTMQTATPDEVIIVDGGSTDDSVCMLKQLSTKKLPFSFRFQMRVGNRSVGRNRAIQLARNPLIAITDAGCMPKKDWLGQLLRAYVVQKKGVIAGYAIGAPTTPFEEAVVPYALVMPDRVDPKTFLPATRSMLIEKEIWSRMKGFDESYSLNEDYVFARKLQDTGIAIGFAEKAIVRWMPRSTLQSFWQMIFSFARGDAQAGLWRAKVLLIFARYALLVVLALVLFVASDPVTSTIVMLLIGTIYVLWSIQKNRTYVPKGWYWLAVLQITSDIAVMFGSLRGLIDQRSLKKNLTN